LPVDFVFVGAPLYVGPRGFFMWLFDLVSAALLLFADSVYVGLPLFVDFCDLFTRL
jgi:hypothetical protein